MFENWGDREVIAEGLQRQDERAPAVLPVANCEYCGSHFRQAPGGTLCSECLEWERILGPRHVMQKPWRSP